MKTLHEGEVDNQFNVFYASRFSGDSVDVMVGPGALRDFNLLIRTYNASVQIIENDVER